MKKALVPLPLTSLSVTPVALVISVLVAGCALSARLLWQLDRSSDWNHDHHLVMSEDQQSLYWFAGHDQELSVEHRDLNGQLLQQYQFDTTPANPYTLPLLTHDNQFFLVGQTARDTRFLDLDSGVRWQGFGAELVDEDDSLEIHNAYLNQNDELVFSASLIIWNGDSISSITGVIGRVSSNGTLEALHRLDDLRFIDLQMRPGTDTFVLTGWFRENSETANSPATVIIEYDRQLNELHRLPQTLYLGTPQVTHDAVISPVWQDGAHQNHAVSLVTGAAERLPIPYESGTRQITGPNSLYQIRSKWESTHPINKPFEVCRYDLNYQPQWCNDTQQNGRQFYDLLTLSVNERDDLAVTFDSGGDYVTGATGKLELVDLQIGGQFDLRGEERTSVTHEVFSAQGKHLFVAQEEPRIGRGILSNCWISLCILGPEWDAGVSLSMQQILLEDRRLLVLNNVDESTGSDRAIRISFWGK